MTEEDTTYGILDIKGVWLHSMTGLQKSLALACYLLQLPCVHTICDYHCWNYLPVNFANANFFIRLFFFLFFCLTDRFFLIWKVGCITVESELAASVSAVHFIAASWLNCSFPCIFWFSFSLFQFCKLIFHFLLKYTKQVAIQQQKLKFTHTTKLTPFNTINVYGSSDVLVWKVISLNYIHRMKILDVGQKVAYVCMWFVTVLLLCNICFEIIVKMYCL